MLKVHLFENSKDIFTFDFVVDKDASMKVVCPNPILADAFREQVNSLGHKATQNIEVVTISKFSKDLLAQYCSNVTLVRKADLLLQLATLWKLKFSHYPYESFLRAFNLLTELRGYTTELVLIEEILNEFDGGVGEAVKFFWMYLENEEIVDEHKANNTLVNYFRSNEYKIAEKFQVVFWGFSQVNSGQIDFFKSIAIRNDVYVTFPKLAISELKKSDWINWLDNTEELEIAKNDQHINVNVINFPKNRLNEYLDYFLEGKKEKINVYLGEKNPNLLLNNEVPRRDSFFKTQIDVFKCEIDQLFEELNEFIGNVEDFLTLIDSLKVKALKKGIFRSLKVIATLIKTIESYKNFSVENEKISKFDIDILKENILLNAPRVSAIPISDKEFKGYIRGLESLDLIKNEEVSVLCASSGYSPLRSFDEAHSERVREFLASIGPIPRKELDFLFIKSKLIEVFDNEGVVLFLEKDLIEHDLAWATILENVQLNYLNLSKREKELKKDSLNKIISNEVNRVKTVSPTRLQAYLDCPRKYYFQYIEKLGTRPSLDNMVRPDQLGTLEHLVIEKFFKNNVKDLNLLNEFAKDIFDNFILENKLKLDLLTYRQCLIEITNYSFNGIDYLLNIKKIYPEIHFYFEYELKNNEVNCSIDCVGVCDDLVFIFDFKRSSFSIPTKKSLLEMKKIQIWFYLKHLNINKNKICWGYLNLSEIENSLIFVNTNLFNLGEDNTIKLNLVEELNKELDQYELIEKDLVQRLKEDKKFAAMPVEESVCAFCVVKNVCFRKNGGINASIS